MKCNCPIDSPFRWRENPRPSIFATDNGARLSINQSAVVDREREKGHDISHVAGLSTKSHSERILNVRQFTVYTRAK
jgi:hypothetical protein